MDLPPSNRLGRAGWQRTAPAVAAPSSYSESMSTDSSSGKSHSLEREAVAWLLKVVAEELKQPLERLERARQMISEWGHRPAYVVSEIDKAITRTTRTADALGAVAVTQRRVAADAYYSEVHESLMSLGIRHNVEPHIRGDLDHPWIVGFSEAGGWSKLQSEVDRAADAISRGAVAAVREPPRRDWAPADGPAAAALRSCWIEQVNIRERRASAIATGRARPEDHQEASYESMVRLYREAATGCLERVTADEVLAVHAAVMDGLLECPGEIREGFVQVGKYVAPDQYDAARLFHALTGWLYEPEMIECLDDDSDAGAARAFVRAAWGHLRFEQIHPFPDGNGRTGRWLETRLMAEHPRLAAVAHEGSTWCWDQQRAYYSALSDAPHGGDPAFIHFAVDRLSKEKIWRRSGPDI